MFCALLIACRYLQNSNFGIYIACPTSARQPGEKMSSDSEYSFINCICCKQPSDDNLRDIFDDELVIRIQERECKALEEFVSLREAVETITGWGIVPVDKAILCKTCFRKVESYVRFRSHLVTLFKRMSDDFIPDLDLSSEENANITDTSLNSKVSICTTGSDLFKETVNDNENSVSNVSNDSNISSSDIDDNLNLESSRSKIRKSDIESDVNVCSGEDDEVLKYVENKNTKTISISSTESEEEYDYGPTFKKIKLSNRISSPLTS